MKQKIKKAVETAMAIIDCLTNGFTLITMVTTIPHLEQVVAWLIGVKYLLSMLHKFL